jgi:glycosyltransferase (activator-dependent family)
MRVLFTTCPDKSIFLSSVPLAWALRTAGHEVRVAAQPRFADVITSAGLTAVPIGRDHDPARLSTMEPEGGAAARTGLFRPYDVVAHPERLDWDYLKSGYEFHVTWWHRIDTQPILRDLVALARHWRPDLVIWEPATYAGPLAAAAVGAAHARLLWSLDVFGRTREHYLRLKPGQPANDRTDPLADWLAAHARGLGVEFTEDLITGQFTIDPFPSSLGLSTGLPGTGLRYTPYGGPATVPGWLWAQPERLRVALTLGITATERFGGYAVGLADILDSLADLDVEVVATVADPQRCELGRVPANTRVVPYVPLHALVPTCAAVIHHAGFGTLATTSLYGVPQLALPLHFDEPLLADKLAEQGAGLTLPAGQATGARVRECLRRLFDEPSFQASADKLRADMLAMPTPNELVPELEERTTAGPTSS